MTNGIRFSGSSSGLVAQAGAIDELDEHAVRGTRMKERHQTLDAAARRVVDELDALFRQTGKRAREVIDDEAEMVQGRAPTLRHEASDTGLRVGRLEQLDA